MRGNSLFGLIVLKLFRKKTQSLLIAISSLLISLAILLPQSKSALGCEFNPLWLVNTMGDAGIGLNCGSTSRFTYLGSHQWLKFSIVEIIGLLIFFIGNLEQELLEFWNQKRSAEK